jgi:hypothetical protein
MINTRNIILFLVIAVVVLITFALLYGGGVAD